MQQMQQEDCVCPICLNAMVVGESGGLAITTTSCNHKFHSACITQWQSRSVSCPICRGDTKNEGNQESQLLKEIRAIMNNSAFNIPNREEQFDAIARFQRGQLSYGEMRGTAG